MFMPIALVAATPECLPTPKVGLEFVYTTTLSTTVTITQTAEVQTNVIDAKYLTIAVTILLGNDVSLLFSSNAGSPTSIGDPSPTVLYTNGFTQYSFPTRWAGRINVGPNFNPYGSKIEGIYTGPPDIDVSYVDG